MAILSMYLLTKREKNKILHVDFTDVCLCHNLLTTNVYVFFKYTSRFHTCYNPLSTGDTLLCALPPPGFSDLVTTLHNIYHISN